MKKEGAANQAGEDGEGYIDEFLFHVLSFKNAPPEGGVVFRRLVFRLPQSCVQGGNR